MQYGKPSQSHRMILQHTGQNKQFCDSVTSKECERMCKKTRGCGYSENAYFEMSKIAQVTRISRS